MKTLQRAFEQTTNELPQTLLAELIGEKAAKHGISLSAKKRAALAKSVLNGRASITVDRWKWWDRRNVVLDLNAEDFEKVSEGIGKFTEQVPALIEELTDRMATEMLADLTKRWRKQSKLVRGDLSAFRSRLYERWKKPIELLRMLHTMCLEVGTSINAEVARSRSAKKTPHLFEVLRRSHARACQITSEILMLLEGGFADGALARWRTLHELSVVASLVADHGEDLAVRYIQHEGIESKRAADEYQQCAPRLGYEPIAEDELDRIRAEFDNLIQKYGKPYGTPNGWAAHHLNHPRPMFGDLDRAAKIDHLRAHYRMASHKVHANPKGVFFQLGLSSETPRILAGPSNSGLSEPGQGTALSLVHVTSILVTLQPTLDNNVTVRALVRLVDMVAEAFAAAEAQLTADETAVRSARRR